MAVDTLTSMTVLRAAVERGSLAAAARTMGLSAEMAGYHLKQLEARLGVRLLNRTTRRLTLTEAGRAYFARCCAILDEIAVAEAEACAGQAEPRGRLRLAAPLAFGKAALPAAVAAFLDRFRHVTLEIELAERNVHLLEEGFDMALRLGELSDSGLVARRLGHFALMPVAAPSYLDRHPPPARPQELADHEALIYTPTAEPRDWRFRGEEGGEERVRVAGRIAASDIGFLCELALAGRGVLLAPEFVVGPAIAAGRLIALLPGFRSRDLPLHALFPHRTLIPAAVRALADFLSDWFRRRGPRTP